ncbi:MAG: hypothetical protein LBV79_09255, partial [Candidatus Adiutrix sp.]|nr:hypothetical protein [Candidatus Adiutrix sp.]
MFKKLLLVLGLMAALSVAPMALAQAPTTEAEMMAAFDKEGPLTQKDIDAYIKIMPKAQEAATDPAKAANLYKDAGLTDIRGAYVVGKVSIAMMVTQLADQAQIDQVLSQPQIPASMKPSADEVALVKKNMEAITK